MVLVQQFSGHISITLIHSQPVIKAYPTAYFESKDNIFTGYLLYNNSYCVLLAYGNKQKMLILKINYNDKEYEIVDEELSIDELRSTLAQYVASGQISDIQANPTGSATASLGKLKVGGIIYDVLKLPDVSDEISYDLCVLGGNLVARKKDHFIADVYISYTNGDEAALSNVYAKEIDVRGATKVFYFATQESPDLRGLAFYDANGDFIAGSGVQISTRAQVVNVPSGAVSCKASVFNPAELVADFED